LLYGVSSVSTRDAEGPGDCGSEVSIDKGDDGVGVCILDITSLWGIFLDCQVSQFLEYCLPD
jgi:hypothetical protein